MTKQSATICTQEEETITHAPCECPAASDVWREEGTSVKKWRRDIKSIQDLWTKIAETLPPRSQALSVIIMRNLWMRRNAFVY